MDQSTRRHVDTHGVGVRQWGVAELSIVSRQNDPAMHALLRAMSVAHARAQRIDGLRTGLSALVAASGLAAALLKVATPITAVGALWAVIYSVFLVTWADGELRRAAVLQEMFDTRLFGMAWNPVLAGDQVGAEEVNRLSKRYRGRADMIQDYYEIPPELAYPFDVIGCQQHGLGWGSRVRTRYAYTVLTVVVTWAAAGVLVGALAELTVGELLLRWYVPSLGFFLLGIDVFRTLRSISRERDRTLRIVRDRIAAVGPQPSPAAAEDLMILARQVQDVLFRTRSQAPRVPNWFFLPFRRGDRADFQVAMDELKEASA